ncbi:MAG: BTAD domain-containing putative transcriptional regulator [Chloroflexota bacterium]
MTPFGTLDRPQLEAGLLAAVGRRLTVLVAGAGYGKSTLAARIAHSRPTAWYTADASDIHTGAFAAGVVAAVRRVVPDLPEDLAAPLVTAVDPTGEAEAAQRGMAAATLIADALQDTLALDLVLVLDDCHALGSGSGSWRFVETLARVAPPGLHLVLVSRSDPPFGIERLRAQGEVASLGGASLAFTTAEIEALVTALLPDEVVPRTSTADAASRIAAATDGWPAAVRLAIEALRAAPDGGREVVLDRLQRPDGPLFPYLAEEVIAAASEEVRTTLAAAACFERFSAPMLEAAGITDAGLVLDGFMRAGLFVAPLPGDPGWFTLHGLLREFARTHLRLDPAVSARLHDGAAAWLEASGHDEEALGQRVTARDVAALAAFLDRRGPALVAAGATRPVTEAAMSVPEALRSVGLERAMGEAFMVRGDWRAATAALIRASGHREQLDPGEAWRLGLVHGLQGAYDEALSVYARGRCDGSAPDEEAMLHAWTASAHYHRGEVAKSAGSAARALELATASGSARALSAAWTAIGMSAELEHDFRRASSAFDRALEAAREGRDTLQEVRIRNARGALEIDLGDVTAAFHTLDEAVGLADAIGFASFHARALVNRGRAHQALGRFEEALVDFSAARGIYERVGSRAVAYPLVREGSLHALRGDTLLARFAFEGAIRAGRGSGDVEALAPALIGLAQVIVPDEPEQARELIEEALRIGRHVAPLTVLLGAARTELALGDHPAARRIAREATNIAAARQDQPGYASGLEIQALAIDDRAEAELLCERACTVWTTSAIPYGYARNRLVMATIATGDRARRAAADAAGVFRSLGARGPAGEAAARLDALDRSLRPALEVGALGRFRVIRDGEPLPAAAWQSRKARDLLKILVTRRARPITRETLFELLWPAEDPEPLANRLSVALATARAVLDPAKAFPPDWFIGGDKQAVWLEPAHIEVDVERFMEAAANGLRIARDGDPAEARRMLDAAQARYTGDFLEEDPYEDWAVGLREEAQAAYIAVTRLLAEGSAADGDADGATRYHLRILERDPYDEAAHLGLVGALLAAGRHGEARRRYGIYSGRMEEMGVEAAPFPARPERHQPGPRRSA